MPGFRRLLALAAAAATVPAAPCVPSPGPAAAPDATAREAAAAAARAYEAGDCAAVLEAFGRLEGEAGLDGISHYRWGFCLAYLRRGDPAPHYEKAAELLSARAAKEDSSLEEHFYRVNALLNLRRGEEARAAAKDAVERWRTGRLVVPEKDPEAWFRLGKLFRDAGDAKGALEPFQRALDVAEKEGKPLRTAYLERIVDAGRAIGAGSLVLRATRMLQEVEPAAGSDPIRLVRARLARGDLAAAREAIAPLVNRPGEAATDARYVLSVIDRALEVGKHKLEPMTELPDGRLVASLSDDELETQIAEVVKEAARLIREGDTRQVALKRREGVRIAPSREVRAALWDQQAKLAGLLLEAVQRGVDLRGWAMRGGYAQLVFKPLVKVFLENARNRAPETGSAGKEESTGD